MTDQLPLVSIVVRTCGDRPTSLLEAVRSVAHQTWPRVELVLAWNQLTGAARANLTEFLERHSQELCSVRGTDWIRPVLVGYQRSAGNAAAWGVRCATGELVGLLDDDDVLRSWHAERLANRLISEPTAAAAYSDVLVVPCDERNHPTGARATTQEGRWRQEELFSGPCPRAEHAFLFRAPLLKLDGTLPSQVVHEYLIRLPAETVESLAYVPGVGCEKRVKPLSDEVAMERAQTLEAIVAKGVRLRRLEQLAKEAPAPDATSPPGGPP